MNFEESQAYFKKLGLDLCWDVDKGMMLCAGSIRKPFSTLEGAWSHWQNIATQHFETCVFFEKITLFYTHPTTTDALREGVDNWLSYGGLALPHTPLMQNKGWKKVDAFWKKHQASKLPDLPQDWKEKMIGHGKYSYIHVHTNQPEMTLFQRFHWYLVMSQKEKLGDAIPEADNSSSRTRI